MTDPTPTPLPVQYLPPSAPWRMEVWRWPSTRFTIELDQMAVTRAGLRMQVTPEGDCREASFIARGDLMKIQPLDAVQIIYGDTPVFYGEVRMGGNAEDVDGHQYILRSMAKLLDEVPVGPMFYFYPQEGDTLDKLIRAVAEEALSQAMHWPADGVPDDWLPFLLNYDDGTSDIKDTGMAAPRVEGVDYETAGGVLNYFVGLSAGRGIQVRYGVNARRQLFWQVARTEVYHIDPEDALHLQWKPPVAEKPYTAVRWFIGKGPYGRWNTYLSRSPEASMYLTRAKTLALSSLEGLWNNVPIERVEMFLMRPGTSDLIPATSTTSWTPTAFDGSTSPPQELSLPASPFVNREQLKKIQDWVNEQADVARITFFDSETSASAIPVLAIKYPEDVALDDIDRITVSMQVRSWHTDSPNYVGSTSVYMSYLSPSANSEPHEAELLSNPENAEVLAVGNMGEYMYGSVDASDHHIYLWSPYPRESKMNNGTIRKDNVVQYVIDEIRLQTLDTATLDRLAMRHYNTPHPTPGEIELRRPMAPDSLHKYITLTRPNGTEYQSIVDAWEYRLTAGRGLTLACMLGQAEDPVSVAQADLIKSRDGNAVIEAIALSNASINRSTQ